MSTIKIIIDSNKKRKINWANTSIFTNEEADCTQMCCCLGRLVLFLHSFNKKLRPPPSHTFNIFPTILNASQMFIDQAHFLRHSAKLPRCQKESSLKEASCYWLHCPMICGSRCFIVYAGSLLISLIFSMMLLSHFISSKCLEVHGWRSAKITTKHLREALLQDLCDAGSNIYVFYTRGPNDRWLAI